MATTNDPDNWTDEDWKKHDAALNRPCKAAADQFARDLDLLGWKIVMNRNLEPGEPEVRWPMNGTRGPCPSWAEDCCRTCAPTASISAGEKPAGWRPQ
jgi:hypothetical protein